MLRFHVGVIKLTIKSFIVWQKFSSGVFLKHGKKYKIIVNYFQFPWNHCTFSNSASYVKWCFSRATLGWLLCFAFSILIIGDSNTQRRMQDRIVNDNLLWRYPITVHGVSGLRAYHLGHQEVEMARLHTHLIIIVGNNE